MTLIRFLDKELGKGGIEVGYELPIEDDKKGTGSIVEVFEQPESAKTSQKPFGKAATGKRGLKKLGIAMGILAVLSGGALVFERRFGLQDISDTISNMLSLQKTDAKYLFSFNVDEPLNVTLADNKLYVSVSEKIKVFDLKGKYISEFEAGESPEKIALLREYVLMTGIWSKDIGVWNTRDNKLYAFGSDRVNNNYDFNASVGIVVNKARVYISDLDNGVIKVFGLDGKYLSKFGRKDQDGYLTRAGAIALSGDNKLYISDWGDSDIKVYSLEGDYLFKFGRKGKGEGEIDFPRDIAISKGKLIVADAGNNKILAFDLNGNYLFQFGKKGEGRMEFSQPGGIAASGNTIYIADFYNNRVQVLKIRD